MANHADAKDVGRSTTGMGNARLEKNAGIRGDASIATRNTLENVDAKDDTNATTPARDRGGPARSHWESTAVHHAHQIMMLRSSHHRLM